MSNRAIHAKKRKKRRVRERKVRAQKEVLKDRDVYYKKYPKIVVIDEYADIELVRGIRRIIREDLDIRDMPSIFQKMLHDFRTLSHSKLASLYSDKMMEKLEKGQFEGDCLEEEMEGYFQEVDNRAKGVQVYCFIEQMLFGLLYIFMNEKGLWDKFMPCHHINVLCYRREIHVIVNSFRTHISSFGRGYYPSSDPLPKVNIKGRDYFVALSQHAVERIGERIGSEKYPFYTPLYIYSAVSMSKLEHIQLTDGTDAVKILFGYTGKNQNDVLSYAHMLAYSLLGKIPDKFDYLCGYAPLGYCRDDFIHLKTFLDPGMNGTPESILFKTVMEKEKRRYKDILNNRQLNEEYIELRRFFQENDCLQIVERD